MSPTDFKMFQPKTGSERETENERQRETEAQTETEIR